MEAHHQRVINRLKAQFENDPNFLALIIGGSVARGWARPDSDVDIVLIATDEEYARREAVEAYHYFNQELCDYPGGYIDGKIVNLGFLEEAADHGSEPARAAFAGAQIGFSRFPGLEDLLRRIVAYPETCRDEKMKSFYSQVLLLNWFVPEAEKRGDPYLLSHATSELVLYAGRLMLAYNRVLYPYHKWFMHVLRMVPDKPADFMALAEGLLEQPSTAAAKQLTDSVCAFRDWGVSFPEAVIRFMKDSEWNWRKGPPPLADS